MISFEVLGAVTAKRDDWAARLSRQQQVMLAVLVIDGAAREVSDGHLSEALWEFGLYPEGGLKRVASELRRELDQVPGSGPVRENGGYRLPVAVGQADLRRFQAKFAEASGAEASGAGARAAAALAREALGEWGPSAGGLHGGEPLRGLPGHWASITRDQLRLQYRDAALSYLGNCLRGGDPGLVLRECVKRAAEDLEALRDEEFLTLWMNAASQTGRTDHALRVFRRAQQAAAHAGEPLGADLQRLATRLRDGDSRPGPAPSTAPRTPIPLTTGRRPMSEQRAEEPRTIFNNYDSVRVGIQVGVVTGTVRIEADRESSGEPTAAEGEDSAEGSASAGN